MDNSKNKLNSKETNKKIVYDEKLKPLRPSLRQKKRFIKAKIISENKIEFKELSENLIENLLLLIGAIEFGKLGIWLLRDKFDYENQEFIIKVGIKGKEKLIASLSMIRKFKSNNVRIETIKTSGTLKGLQ